ncbi:MAG: glycerol kinase GlpK [Bacteriovoracaceae bacterium]
MKFILSLDQGTTGSTAALICADTLKFVAKSNTEFPQIFPKSGWVEHNLDDIWNSIRTSTLDVFKKANASADNIIAIGITNQRETTCAFDKNGKPLHNAIVWQDRRTSSWCLENKKNLEENLKEKTGLPLDPYFSGTKMMWLLENSEDVKKAALDKNLKFGTIDTYLIYKLTGSTSHVTDTTNASRTLLMDLESLCFDSSLLETFKIPNNTLPEIKNSVDQFGETKGLDFLPDGIPITGVLGDQQAALYGQACFNPGEMKCTYGTGAFLLANTGDKIVHSKAGLLTTVAFTSKEKTHYALEGSSYIAGAAVQWLRDNLKFFNEAPKIEELAKNADMERCQELIFFPFFSGIGSPYWAPEAKAAIVGMDRGTNQEEISRACLEGIALSINDLINAVRSDYEGDVNSLKVDGGAVANNFLMQLQSNFSKLTIVRPEVIETTAYGAALAAIKGHKGLDDQEIQNLWEENQSFNPESDLDYYNKKAGDYTGYIKSNFL